MFSKKKVLKVAAAAALFAWGASSAFALSDAEYRKFMKNDVFRTADKALSAAWNQAKQGMSSAQFEKLRADQRVWVKSGRDAEAGDDV